MQSGYWQDRTTADFRHLDPETTVALLPVAAVEQHGPHLPLSTDALINDGLVRAALALVSSRTTLLVLPALSVGLSPEHTSFPGTLAIADSTLADAWTDVGRSVARAGVRKLVILNTHGGQKALVDLVAMRLRAEPKMLVARATYFAFGAPPGLFDSAERAHDIHGGEVETSLMLHLAPQLVRKEALADFKGLPHELAARNQRARCREAGRDRVERRRPPSFGRLRQCDSRRCEQRREASRASRRPARDARRRACRDAARDAQVTSARPARWRGIQRATTQRSSGSSRI